MKRLLSEILAGLSSLLVIGCSQAPDTQFSLLSASETGLVFRNDIQETQQNNILTYEYTYNGAGIAAGDVNKDGFADLYFAGNSVPNRLFLNKGGWKFNDVSEASGTFARKGWKTGVTMADVNGDGWLDIYVCFSGNAPGEGYNLPVVREYPERANQLFINNGCEPGGVPTFTERAKEFGIDAIGTFSTQAYFFDYDLDNDLDMFLVNHANMFYSAFFNTKHLRNLRHPYFGNRLYRNDTDPKGKISFTDVSKEAGFHGSGLNFGLSAAISDFNFDGYPDIYVTNDFEEQDFCYINNGDGSFRESSHKMFGHLSKFGMGSDVADINNDALQDLIVLDMLPEDNHRQKLLKGPDEYDRYQLAVDSGYHHQYMRNTLHINRGFATDSLPRFSEIGQLAGVSNTDWSWSPFLVDLDNDGLRDLFVTNGYLRDYTNLDFMKYTGDVYNAARSSNNKVDYLQIIQQLPQTKLNNYVFRNVDGIHFEKKNDEWGLSKKSVSNGAIYADLDNDGDVDLVTNNLNDEPTILRNNQNVIQKNNFIKIRLSGPHGNRFGIGAKVVVLTDSASVFQEVFFTRGYASSVEPVLTLGIGRAATIRSITVAWPDRATSLLENLQPNSTVSVSHDNASAGSSAFALKVNEVVVKDVTSQSGIDFAHKENSYIDFKSQRLLLHQLSRLGGKLATADVDRDGNDDVFFGNAAGQPAALYFGNDNGTFRKGSPEPWKEDAAFEDIESVFFDADRDGDQDLYVVSGGSEFATSSPLYQDRLYLNDGAGNFKRAPDNVLPAETTSGSCVVAADFDQDGDEDLFVGARHTPGNYGLIPRSFILQNNSTPGKIAFTDVTSKVAAAVATLGMVTDATWVDLDNDRWPELIVAGEWMPVSVFRNTKGQLAREASKELEHSEGWWCEIAAADVDNDGDSDVLLGNAGLNLPYRASSDQPITLFAGDFNNDGALDPVVTSYIQNKPYPIASRDELLEQITPLRKKFIKYADYADAGIADIATDDLLAKAYRFEARQLSSCWLENVDGVLQRRELPAEAQFSSVNSFVHEDFDGDKKNEVLVAGNFFPFRAQMGRSDASMGLILRNTGRQLEASRDLRAQLWLTGDIRDVAALRFRSGARRVVVSRNNDRAGVFTFD